MKSIIALSFLVMSTAFVATLIKSLITMMSTDWDKKKLTGKSILDVFKYPILSFVLLIVFIAFILPILEQQ